MLNGQNFVQEIDKEKSNVTIIVHVYEDVGFVLLAMTMSTFVILNVLINTHTYLCTFTFEFMNVLV